MQGEKRKSATSTPLTSPSKRGCRAFSSITDDEEFKQRYVDWLPQFFDSDTICDLSDPPDVDISEVEKLSKFLAKLVGYQFLTYDLVLQVRGKETPKYLLVWTMLMIFGVVQAGSSKSVFKVAVPNIEEGDNEEEDNNDEEEHPLPALKLLYQEFFKGKLSIGYEEDIKGLVNNGRTEFVVLRACQDAKISGFASMQTLLRNGICMPVLVLEVKANVNHSTHVWQPLAFAMELAALSGTSEPVWVLLTDMDHFYFYSVTKIAPNAEGQDVNKYNIKNEAYFAGSILGNPKTYWGQGFMQALLYLYHHLFPGQDNETFQQQFAEGEEVLINRGQTWLDDTVKVLKERAVNKESVRLAEERASKEAEGRRLAEERASKEAEGRRLAEERASKEEEGRRQEAEGRRQEAEGRRLAEERASKEEEGRRQEAEGRRLAEERASMAEEEIKKLKAMLMKGGENMSDSVQPLDK